MKPIASLNIALVTAILAVTAGHAAGAQQDSGPPEAAAPAAPIEPAEEPGAAALPAAGAETAAGQGEAANPAVQRARRALSEAESTPEADHPDLAGALRALAVAHAEAGDFKAAESTLEREIALLEKQHGLYAAEISEPLDVLGEVYLEAGRYEDAIEAFRRAQHLVHRSDGVYSLRQLDYIDKMSRGFLAMRDLAEADRHHRFSYFVSERNFGPDNPELVPAILKLADWYRRIGSIRESRRLYKRAVEVVEDALGPNHPMLIKPLLGLGTTTVKKTRYKKDREIALKRMVGIVEGHPDLDAADRARSWAHLGDFYVIVSEQERAEEAYAKGWEELRGDDSLPADQAGLFSQPVALRFPTRIYLMEQTPGVPIDGYERTMIEMQVEVEFELSIGADGRVLDVRAVNLQANANTRRQIRRYVREARFRPRIVAGKPVRTDGFRFKEKLTIIRPRV